MAALPHSNLLAPQGDGCITPSPKVKAEWLHYPTQTFWTRMVALPHPSQKRQSPATCPTHTASSAISTILPRPCGGGPTRRLDGGPQSTPLGGTQSIHDAIFPTSSGCITPHADGCITPSFTEAPIAGHMPHAHGIKRDIHHLTPPLRRRPCSEARWRSAVDPVGKHAINT